jgi:hypothetical protein
LRSLDIVRTRYARTGRVLCDRLVVDKPMAPCTRIGPELVALVRDQIGAVAALRDVAVVAALLGRPGLPHD